MVLLLVSPVNCWDCALKLLWFDEDDDDDDGEEGLFKDMSTPPDSLLSVVSSFVTCILSFPAFPAT